MAIIIKKESGTGIPKAGERVKVIISGKEVGRGVKTGGSGSSTNIRYDSGSAVQSAKETTSVIDTKKQESDIEKIQRKKATQSIGLITKRKVLPSGEVQYIGVGGKKYTFPSETEISFDPAYHKEVRGGTGKEEIRERLTTASYQRTEQKAREEALRFGREVQASLQRRMLEQKVEQREPLTMEEVRQYQQLMGKRVIERVSPLAGVELTETTRGYYKLKKGEKAVTATPELITAVEIGKPTAEFRPEFFGNIPPQMFSLPVMYPQIMGEELSDYAKARIAQYKAIGEAETWVTPIAKKAVEKGKEYYPIAKTMFGTSLQVAAIPKDIFIRSWQDLMKNERLRNVYETERASISGGISLLAYPYTSTKKVLTGFGEDLPSSKEVRDYFVGRSKKDIPFTGGLAKFNIVATDIMAGGYEYARKKPGEIIDIFASSYILGGGLGTASRLGFIQKGIKYGGVALGGLYVGSIGLQAYMLPLEQKGSFLGQELVRGSAFAAGFGLGYREFYTPPLAERLTMKGGLEYRGQAIFEQTPAARRYGIITERYSKIKKVETSGIISGTIEGRKGSRVYGSFLEDVSKGRIYEDRFIEYESLLFRKQFLAKEIIFPKEGRSITRVFELGKKTKLIGLFDRPILPEYYSPIARGFEKQFTRQIKSMTPERAIELYINKKGEIRQRIIQTGRQQDLLRKLRIEQERLAGTIEISPYAITKTRTKIEMSLLARQKRPQKNILSYLEFRPDVDLLRYEGKPAKGFEPFYKMKIKEQAQFRDLYFGLEKYESRAAKYVRELFPRELTAGLARSPKIVKLPKMSEQSFFTKTTFPEDLLYFNLKRYAKLRTQFEASDLAMINKRFFETTRGVKRSFEKSPFLDFMKSKGDSLLKEYKITFQPTKYIGLEEQFVPALIAKQQKIRITQEFSFRIPTQTERVYIQSVLNEELTKREKEQRLFEKFLSGKYTTRELFKEIYPRRVPVIDKKGRVLTPNYLKKLNQKFRQKTIKQNEKAFRELSKAYTKARQQITAEYPGLAESIRLRTARKGQLSIFQKMIEKRAETLRFGISPTKFKVKGKSLSTMIKAIVQPRGMQAPKVIPILQPKTTTRTRIRTEQALNQFSKSFARAVSKSNVEAQLKNELNLRSNIKFELKGRLRNNLMQNLQQNLRQNQTTMLQLETFSYISLTTGSPYTPPPPPPPPPPLIHFNIQQRKRKKSKSKKYNIRFRYLPSLVAVSENIFGARPDILSGLRIRPL